MGTAEFSLFNRAVVLSAKIESFSVAQNFAGQHENCISNDCQKTKVCISESYSVVYQFCTNYIVCENIDSARNFLPSVALLSGMLCRKFSATFKLKIETANLFVFWFLNEARHFLQFACVLPIAIPQDPK